MEDWHTFIFKTDSLPFKKLNRIFSEVEHEEEYILVSARHDVEKEAQSSLAVVNPSPIVSTKQYCFALQCLALVEEKWMRLLSLYTPLKCARTNHLAIECSIRCSTKTP